MIASMPNKSAGLLPSHLGAVAECLCRFLGQHLPEIGGEDWWVSHVVSQLTYGQQGQLRARGINRLEGLDLAALLRIFERNWAEISYRCHLPAEVRTHAREVADLRNLQAHSGATETPADTDLYRALDTLHRFLLPLDADTDALERLEKARDEALRRMAPGAASQATAITPAAEEGDGGSPEATVDTWAGLPSHKIGRFVLHGPGDALATEIPSFVGKPVAATANPWRVTGPDGLEFLIQVVMVDEDTDGEFGQVFCESRLGSPQLWDDVVKRLRVGIRRTGDGLLTMDLRATCRNPGGRASRQTLALPELAALVGLDPSTLLPSFGALGVGTREELYGETNKWRNWPAVTFATDDILTPAAAWVVTTLSPLVNSES